MTITQTATRLNMNRQTVYQWIKAGRIPATVDAAGHYDIPADALPKPKRQPGRRVKP